MEEKSVMPRWGTIRDERGYTEAERARLRTTYTDFMHTNVRKKLFPGAL
jgi:hypothetical protein